MKATFVKSFTGDIRVSSTVNKEIQDQIQEEENRKEKERMAMEQIVKSKNIWDIKWR